MGGFKERVERTIEIHRELLKVLPEKGYTVVLGGTWKKELESGKNRWFDINVSGILISEGINILASRQYTISWEEGLKLLKSDEL